MPWKNQGGGPWGQGPKGPWGGGPQSVGPRPPDLEDLLRRGQDKLQQLLPGGHFSGIGPRRPQPKPLRLCGMDPARRKKMLDTRGIPSYPTPSMSSPLSRDMLTEGGLLSIPGPKGGI